MILKLIKNFFSKPAGAALSLPAEPVIIPRSAHPISRKQISPNALKVLYRLREAGFAVYLVGGCVRDLLLGREPQDFDVATNAEPEQIHDLFRSAIIIGRRFRLVHVRFWNEIIEVATFRQGGFVPDDEKQHNQHGMIVRDNQYGSINEDVIRRDFTVNALYYNIMDFSVIDFMGGVQDIEAGVLRIIGDPLTRFREDPVRILRAIRFAAKLGFSIEPDTKAAIPETAPLLTHVAPARLFDEALKLLSSGFGAEAFVLLRRYDLLSYLFPMTEKVLHDVNIHQEADNFFITMLRNTDSRIADRKGINPSFMLAAMLWYSRQQRILELLNDELPMMVAHEQAANEVLAQQIKHTAIPRRLTNMVREIWQLQFHLEKRRPHRVKGLLVLHRFRLGYDFLLLRAEVEPGLSSVAQWWTELYDADEARRDEMIEALLKKPKKKGRRKKTKEPKVVEILPTEDDKTI
ncbi:MAG: polynucleotide adenylyltransferase PcnB [Legionellales bacterium]|nr:polynucleotide adenylyltransferase PcnB [Legionellales bacterium]